MTWGRPTALYLLWALPVVALFVGVALRARARALTRLGPLVPALASAGTARTHRTRAAALVVALGLGIAALAQPRWGFQWQELHREGLSIAVVLDVSRSMDAADVSPTRMERARREALDLADLLAGDKVGLVLFAAGAYPRMPLTLDYEAFREIVRQSDSQTLRAQGSDIGAGIDAARELLGPPPAGGEREGGRSPPLAQGAADRVIVLVSDGEDHAGTAREAAARAAADGIHIFAIGVGTEGGAPVPLPDGGFETDASGGTVLSRLDEDTLRAAAAAGSGAYARSAAGSAELRAIYEDEIRGRLQGAEQGVRRDKVWDERYQWPLAAALIALVAGAAVRPGRTRAAAPVAAALLLVVPFAGRAGDDAIEKIGRLESRVAESPDDLAAAERLGQALFEAGDWARAEDVLGDVARRTADPSQRRRARYNQGLAAYRGGRLHDALGDWKQVLEEESSHESASQNAAAVEKEIALRTNPQEPPPPAGGEGEPQEGDQEAPQSPDGEQAQEGASEDGAPRDAEGPDGEAGERGEIADPKAPAGGTGDTGSPDGKPEGAAARPGSLSSDEAARLLDGVKEGKPRAAVGPNARGGPDW